MLAHSAVRAPRCAHWPSKVRQRMRWELALPPFAPNPFLVPSLWWTAKRTNSNIENVHCATHLLWRCARRLDTLASPRSALDCNSLVLSACIQPKGTREANCMVVRKDGSKQLEMHDLISLHCSLSSAAGPGKPPKVCVGSWHCPF